LKTLSSSPEENFKKKFEGETKEGFKIMVVIYTMYSICVYDMLVRIKPIYWLSGLV